MTQPTVPDGNGNRIPLRDYIERLFAEHQRAHDLQHAASEQTRRDAQADIQRRLTGLNELRNEVIADRNQFVRRDVYEQRHAALENRLSALESQAVRDQEMHSNTVPAFRVVQTSVDEHGDRLDRLEDAAQRAVELEAERRRQRKWLVGLTVTVVLAVAAILMNLLINLTQGVP